MYKSQDYINKKLLELDKRITEICISRPDLIPNEYDYSELCAIRREMLDVSDGENTILFDKLGRPHIMYVVACDDRALTKTYADFIGSEISADWQDILPPFIGDNCTYRYVCFDKYRPIEYNGKNYSLGLYNLPPAYGGSGFSVSYDGVNAECDRVNLSSSYSDGIKIHQIRWDEYGLLAVQMAKDGWEPHGNDTLNQYFANPSEHGAPSSRFLYNNKHPHHLTGTGPLSWRHNGKGTGIADMRGPTLIALSGVRTRDGRLEIIDFRKTGNNGSKSKTELDMNSNLWKGINAETGLFEAPADAGQYFLDSVKASGEVLTNGWAHRINNKVVNRIDSYYSSTTAKNVTLAAGVKANPILKYLNFYKYDNSPLQGQQWVYNKLGASYVVFAGSNWTYSSYGGVALRYCYYGSASADCSLGALLASETNTLEN